MTDESRREAKKTESENQPSDFTSLETKNETDADNIPALRKLEKYKHGGIKRPGSTSRVKIFDKDGMLPIGRPTKLTPETAKMLIDALVNGSNIRQWCKDNDEMPGTVYRWIEENSDLRDAVQRARVLQAHSMVDNLIPIISNHDNDLYDNGKVIAVNTSRVQRDFRHVGVIQWLAGKYNPLYADRDNGVQVNVQVNNAIDAPRQETREEWLERRKKEEESK